MFFIQQYIFEKKKKNIYKLHIIPDVPFFIQTILKRGNEITTMSQ